MKNDLKSEKNSQETECSSSQKYYVIFTSRPKFFQLYET